MQPPDGDVFHLSGVFREVDPPVRLAYTFRWEEPDPDDRETMVTLSLRDLGESTSEDHDHRKLRLLVEMMIKWRGRTCPGGRQLRPITVSTTMPITVLIRATPADRIRAAGIRQPASRWACTCAAEPVNLADELRARGLM